MKFLPLVNQLIVSVAVRLQLWFSLLYKGSPRFKFLTETLKLLKTFVFNCTYITSIEIIPFEFEPGHF